MSHYKFSKKAKTHDLPWWAGWLANEEPQWRDADTYGRHYDFRNSMPEVLNVRDSRLAIEIIRERFKTTSRVYEENGNLIIRNDFNWCLKVRPSTSTEDTPTLILDWYTSTEKGLDEPHETLVNVISPLIKDKNTSTKTKADKE